MANFFRLHHRKDLVLYKIDNIFRIGVILEVANEEYLLRTLGIRLNESSASENIRLKESEIIQKIGELNIDSLEESTQEFAFANWALEESF